MVVISRNRLFVKSDAALEIVRQLKMPWRLLRVLKVVPRPVRDAIYDLVASRRYAWFGKKDSCMVPPAELRSRFLD
jgi:predicted DCC family thiol-disulfide oxidoreductase YuxK